ncbi:MAG: hypothetical protein DRJ03_05135 [Chloroflexi bacterium]|nr:MAG: hypothetical protein DRI81_00565 [Chloroflexota bacterium]RLC87730.1 MAG: hypothetical protein DRJ03_05135 [Chloroflexota bacterium]
MKQITREWLTFARKDIASCERLLGDDFLTNAVAFHAQQAVEKSFKAIIEEFEIGFIRTHDLIRLYTTVKGHLGFEIDVEMIKRLNEVYIEVRYPGELGLLPYGEPTVEEVGGFYEFARGVLEEVKLGLKQRVD